ncbi:MAG: prepilin peptidase [Deltaproteobacteria bacterium]|nr:prepilin peptidase [Deltaproteobacteria bacterium]
MPVASSIVPAVISAIFGAVVGSFLNVCIYRIPEEKSIVFPASHCPHCKKAIRFYDNIPIVSYILLLGKCRNCHTAISPVYPAVELVTGALSVALYLRYGIGFKYFFTFIFACALIVITFIDIKHQIIPDVISLPGIPLFALAGIFIMGLSWKDSMIGILAGGGVLFAVAAGYQLLKKAEGMGGGDIKLLAMIGGFLGWQSLLFVILISSSVGAVIGISVILYNKGDMKYAIPFGPFLSIAAVSYLFWGETFMKLLLQR